MSEIQCFKNEANSSMTHWDIDCWRFRVIQNHDKPFIMRRNKFSCDKSSCDKPFTVKCNRPSWDKSFIMKCNKPSCDRPFIMNIMNLLSWIWWIFYHDFEWLKTFSSQYLNASSTDLLHFWSIEFRLTCCII